MQTNETNTTSSLHNVASAASTKIQSWKLAWSKYETQGLGILVGYLCVTFFLTHVNLNGTMFDTKNLPDHLSLIDKVYHFLSYGLMTFLVLFAFTGPSNLKSKRIRITSAKKLFLWSAFVFCYSIFDESTQPMFGRNFEMFDLLANLVGIAAGQVLFIISEVTGARKKLMKML